LEVQKRRLKNREEYIAEAKSFLALRRNIKGVAQLSAAAGRRGGPRRRCASTPLGKRERINLSNQ